MITINNELLKLFDINDDDVEYFSVDNLDSHHEINVVLIVEVLALSEKEVKKENLYLLL